MTAIKTSIGKIDAYGVQLTDGQHVPLDVLVCATGFNVSGAPPFEIVGRDGITMEERFKPYPEAYMSIAADGFPNFALMMGPNSGVGTGSLTKVIETVGDYIIKNIRKIQKEDIKAMQVKPARARDWSTYIDAYFLRTVYLDSCKSWWRSNNGLGTRIVGIW